MLRYIINLLTNKSYEQCDLPYVWDAVGIPSPYYGEIIGTVKEIDPDHDYPYCVDYVVNGQYCRKWFALEELVNIQFTLAQ